MENKAVVKNYGISFCGLLTVVFIALKLCHVIDWAWIWVLAPAWISFSLGILIILIVVILSIIINR